MNGCPHAQTTTVAWLYGEGTEAHAEHVAGCAACTETLQSHEIVLGAMVPLAAHHRRSVGGASRSYGWALALVAAVMLSWLWLSPWSGDDGPTEVNLVQVAEVPSSIWTTELDQEIDALSLAIDDLSEDFSTL